MNFIYCLKITSKIYFNPKGKNVLLKHKKKLEEGSFQLTEINFLSGYNFQKIRAGFLRSSEVLLA